MSTSFGNETIITWIRGYLVLICTIYILTPIHISAREDCLAEGKIIIDELEGTYKETFKEEFDNQWRLAIEPYYDEWLSVKKKYPIGMNVEGICKYFYPQGAIVEGRDYFAVYTGKKELMLNNSLTACVKKYDEDNLWLVLE